MTPKAKDGRETLQERQARKIVEDWLTVFGTMPPQITFVESEALQHLIAKQLDAAQAEIARMKAIVRVNGLRWGHTHADIDALIGADPSASDDFRQPEAAPEGIKRQIIDWLLNVYADCNTPEGIEENGDERDHREWYRLNISLSYMHDLFALLGLKAKAVNRAKADEEPLFVDEGPNEILDRLLDEIPTSAPTPASAGVGKE